MKFLKSFFIFLLSLLFVTFSFLYMLGLSAERTIFRFEFYEGVVKELDIFSDISNSLEKEFGDQFSGEELSFVDVFDKYWVEEQFLVGIEDILLYTKGEKPSPTVTIDLSEKKDLLLDSFEDEMSQEEMMVQDDDFPSEIALSELLEDDDTRALLSNISMFRNYFPVFSYVVFFLVLVLLLLLLGLSGGLKKYGVNMVVAGIMFFTILILYRFVLSSGFFAELGILPSSFNFVILILEYMVLQILYIPVIYFLVGLFLIIAGILISKIDFNRY